MRVSRERSGPVAVIRKDAETADEAERLARQRRWLSKASHPGVVQLVATDDGSLCTRDVGPRSLETCGALPAEEIAGLGAAAATTLADLHDLGLVHGGPDARHVLVDNEGRPVLCGFADAGPFDPAGGARDVRLLGQALAAHLSGAGHRGLRATLDRAVRATAVGRGRAMPARVFAARLASAVAEPRLPARTATSGDGGASVTLTPPQSAGASMEKQREGPPEPGTVPSRPPSRRRDVALVAVALAALAGVGFAASSDLGGRGAPAGAPLAAWPPRPRPAARRAPPPHPAEPATAPSLAGAAAAATCPPVDAGCAPLTVRSGVFLAHGRRWRLSAPADVVVVGRWDCSEALLAALDRGDGTLWVFPTWGRSAGRLIGSVLGARSLRVRPGAAGCDELEVLRRDGPPRLIEPHARSAALAAPSGGAAR